MRAEGIGLRLVGTLLIWLYGLIGSLLALLMLPVWLLADARSGGGTAGRYGIIPRAVRRAAEESGTIWMHAASVGEAGVLARILPRIAALTPDLPVVVTTFTATGRERARQLLGDTVHLLYPPLDAPLLVRRTIRRLHPQVLVIAETELWPNLLRQAARYGTHLVVVNGRLSVRGFRRYRLLRAGLRPILAGLDLVCVKSPEDAGRFISLGVRPETVQVTGELKSEPLAQIEDEPVSGRRLRLGLPIDRPVFTAGSTRQGEEEIVLEAVREVLGDHPDLLVVLAPRYPHRAAEVEALGTAAGFQVVRRSAAAGGAASGPADILLLDTIGELEIIYAASDVAFVGGSLVPTGGHNLLEPAIYGVPVLFGPHTGETGGADELLISAGGGRRVASAHDLAQTLSGLLADPDRRRAIGEAGQRAVAARGGARREIVIRYRRMLGLTSSAGRGRRPDRGSILSPVEGEVEAK